MLWRHLGRPAARGAGEFRTREDRFRPAGLLVPLLLLILPLPALAQTDFPALTGRVVDQADLLSETAERRLTAQLEAHEAETTNQVVVVTLPSLQGQTIERFGRALGNHWGIGQAGRDNGVLLIVAMRERKVRIEVGTGLEGVLSDHLAKIIIENEITPNFKRGAFEAGVSGGTTAILQALHGSYEAPSKFFGGFSLVNPAVGLFLGFIVLIFFFTFFLSHKHAHQKPQRRRRYRHVDEDGRVWTFAEDGFGRRKLGGGFGGSGGGGGGFTGGGGSFGGGGASGSW